MAEEDSGELDLIFESKKLRSALGRKESIDGIKERFFRQKKHEEVPESRTLAPDMARVKQVVCNQYQVNE